MSNPWGHDGREILPHVPPRGEWLNEPQVAEALEQDRALLEYALERRLPEALLELRLKGYKPEFSGWPIFEWVDSKGRERILCLQ